MTEPTTFAEAVASTPLAIVELPVDPPMARHVEGLARAADRAAKAVAIGRQVEAVARAHARAAEIDRSVRATARAVGIDPGAYAVLTPGTPEHARAERDLQRARAL